MTLRETLTRMHAFPRAENLEFLNLIHQSVVFPLLLVFQISCHCRQGHPDRADGDPGAAVQDREPDPGQPPEGARDRQGQAGDTFRQAGQADPHQVSLQLKPPSLTKYFFKVHKYFYPCLFAASCTRMTREPRPRSRPGRTSVSETR